jgi:serine/threonine-protein kinase
LVKKLATGGMAEIWLARQRGLAGFNRFVVIKKILSHLSEQETFVKMFLDEARTSAQLNHPNVVQIYDLGREADSYYIAMEFIAGENLAAIAWRGMKRGRPLPAAFAARVIADTCKALHYAHHLRGSDGAALEIVHRDISPQNILVTYEGEVKVVDFGIAKATTKSEHTKTGMLKGKFSYMSPEQCLGAPVDMRSDIFALGILLYELCTGKRLFKHESELMILEMITKRSVVPPSQVAPGISQRLEDVIMTALEKPVESRYQTAQDMQIAIEDYLREEDRAATNADIAAYMRTLFEDKIEEKRLLREAASRDDFESAFGDDEPTEQALDTAPGNRRKVVHGLPPSQVRIVPGNKTPSGPAMNRASLPGQMMPTGMMPASPMTPQGMMMVPGQTPMGFTNGAYPPGQVPGMSYPGALSAYGQSLSGAMPVEGSGVVAKLVIGCALLVIVVASTILYQQLMKPEPTPSVTPTTVSVATAPVRTGKLLLDSQPSGAVIFLDDKPMTLDNGEQARTPSDLTSLQYGVSYKIRLVKEGHDSHEQTIVMGDDTNGHTVKPKLKAKPGKLIAEVAGQSATEAHVFFNGKEAGKGPLIEERLEANEVVLVTAKAPGTTCVADPSRPRIPPDGVARTTIRCEAGLKPQPQSSEDRGSHSGGSKAGVVAARTPRPPKAASEHEGDAAASKGEGPPGCKANPNLPPGYITIATNPVSDIFIGDKKIGQTPLAKVKVPSGCVVVKAVSADGKSVTEKLLVDPNVVKIYRFEVK